LTQSALKQRSRVHSSSRVCKNNPSAKQSLARPPQLAASFISNRACNVCYWHLADNPTASVFVRYWTVISTGRRNTWGQLAINNDDG
jgi:hypothetical protein